MVSRRPIPSLQASEPGRQRRVLDPGIVDYGAGRRRGCAESTLFASEEDQPSLYKLRFWLRTLMENRNCFLEKVLATETWQPLRLETLMFLSFLTAVMSREAFS